MNRATKRDPVAVGQEYFEQLIAKKKQREAATAAAGEEVNTTTTNVSSSSSSPSMNGTTNSRRSSRLTPPKASPPSSSAFSPRPTEVVPRGRSSPRPSNNYAGISTTVTSATTTKMQPPPPNMNTDRPPLSPYRKTTRSSSRSTTSSGTAATMTTTAATASNTEKKKRSRETNNIHEEEDGDEINMSVSSSSEDIDSDTATTTPHRATTQRRRSPRTTTATTAVKNESTATAASPRKKARTTTIDPTTTTSTTNVEIDEAMQHPATGKTFYPHRRQLQQLQLPPLSSSSPLPTTTTTNQHHPTTTHSSQLSLPLPPPPSRTLSSSSLLSMLPRKTIHPSALVLPPSAPPSMNPHGNRTLLSVPPPSRNRVVEAGSRSSQDIYGSTKTTTRSSKNTWTTMATQPIVRETTTSGSEPEDNNNSNDTTTMMMDQYFSMPTSTAVSNSFDHDEDNAPTNRSKYDVSSHFVETVNEDDDEEEDYDEDDDAAEEAHFETPTGEDAHHHDHHVVDEADVVLMEYDDAMNQQRPWFRGNSIIALIGQVMFIYCVSMAIVYLSYTKSGTTTTMMETSSHFDGIVPPPPLLLLEHVETAPAEAEAGMVKAESLLVWSNPSDTDSDVMDDDGSGANDENVSPPVEPAQHWDTHWTVSVQSFSPPSIDENESAGGGDDTLDLEIKSDTISSTTATDNSQMTTSKSVTVPLEEASTEDIDESSVEDSMPKPASTAHRTCCNEAELDGLVELIREWTRWDQCSSGGNPYAAKYSSSMDASIRRHEEEFPKVVFSLDDVAAALGLDLTVISDDTSTASWAVMLRETIRQRNLWIAHDEQSHATIIGLSPSTEETYCQVS